MGMPVTVEIIGDQIRASDFEPIFDYFREIDQRFSTYKEDSEISKINRGEIQPANYSDEMKTVFRLAEETRKDSNGFFNIGPIGRCDPSGIVKGWAINNAALLLQAQGFENFYVDAGGDVSVLGSNASGDNWRVGIRNPFNLTENVKILSLTHCGIATSGNYERGEHIYNPKDNWQKVSAVASITVIGPDIYEADRFATAAFVMGEEGINFIENRPGLEGYMISRDGLATMTTDFEKYILNPTRAKQC